MSDPPATFNLWSDPWIRVTRADDGGEAELGIGVCLAEAHCLAALSDPSPLVVGGTHRLLAAILQAIYAPRDPGDIAALLRAGKFDPALLEQFAAQHVGRFELFHPTAPFLQTGDVPLDGWRKPGKGQKNDWGEPKPVASLFVEVPAETNRTHFHHVTDEGHRLCPACCARGLLTIPSFVSSGGAGNRPSINGVPPVYVFPAGSSLFESLALSLVGQEFQPRAADPARAGAAIWSEAPVVARGGQVSAVGYLESLTFPARRMRLYPQTGRCCCTACGQPTSLSVGSMLFEMGQWLSEGSGVWDDPFAAYRKPRGRAKSDDGPRPVRPEEGKALWREYSVLLLTEQEDQLRPRVVQQLAKLIDRGALPEDRSVRFRCIGIRTDGKAKFFEWLDEALEAPPALLTDDHAAQYIGEALGRAGEVELALRFAFDRHFRPERDRGGYNDKLARFKSVRARMLTDYWQRLAPQFRRFVNDLTTEDGRGVVAAAWVDSLIREGRAAFDTAAEQVGEQAEALRARVEGQHACRRKLAKLRKEWLDGEQ